MWRQSERAANVQVDALSALANGGAIQLYAGTQPASLTAPREHLLAEIPLATPAFEVASDGRAFVRPEPSAAFALAGGAPGWFLVVDSAGVPVGSGKIGEEMDLDRRTVEKGAHLIVSGFALRAPHV